LFPSFTPNLQTRCAPFRTRSGCERTNPNGRHRIHPVYVDQHWLRGAVAAWLQAKPFAAFVLVQAVFCGARLEQHRAADRCKNAERGDRSLTRPFAPGGCGFAADDFWFDMGETMI